MMNQRVHEPYHERRLEQQMLDTLLRIEEILARAFPEAPAVEAVPEEVANAKPGGILKGRRR